MFIILPFVVLLSTLPLIEGTCRSFDNYYILGELVTTPPVEQDCDPADICTYVSLDIPAFAVGSFAGCSGDVHMRLIVGILSKRKDLHDGVQRFLQKHNMSLTYPKFSRLASYGDQLHRFKTFSGEGKIFLHFSNQGKKYSEPAINFKPPASGEKPAKCGTDTGKRDCFEGYCAMVEIGSVSKDGKSQVSKKIQDCPTRVYDELYLISESLPENDFNQALLDDLKKVGTICAQRTTHTELFKGGASSFYWHVDCFVPPDSPTPIQPAAFIFHTPHNYFSFPIYKDGK
ncbi:Hypothetical protein SRAE_1000308000 [Strongyloides ratti]|uniref:Uncharacterized protein n=1 Tax=Strongyloides ratti TaxID=34506 RepID=A0A090L531_STRRB|nr:Hypothetical protein SRAE_1000308000 [Strongyloides ratti]CEF64827.1 Hypothetical protein SRAE_1000308000 [Strongyloides ratti]